MQVNLENKANVYIHNFFPLVKFSYNTENICSTVLMLSSFCVVVQDLFQQPQNVHLSTVVDSTKSLPETEVETQLSKLPRPDVTQMLPFKPKILVRKFSCYYILYMVL